MADVIPTNALRGIYANKPAETTNSNSTELNDVESQRSIDPNAPGQHTKGEFILGRSAILAILAVTVVIIVLVVVVVIKAGQIAKKNKAEKKAKQDAENKAKQDADKAAGIVSAAYKQYVGGAGVVTIGLSVLAQVLLL